MQIILLTQYRENYGAHDWDGKGECPQYWKNKGGDCYVITDVDASDDLAAVVQQGIDQLECCYTSDFSEEHLADWYVTNDGELTPAEKDQMEWDKKISYPSRRISLNAFSPGV